MDFPRLVCLGQEGLSEWSFTAMTLGHSNLKDLGGPEQSIHVGFQPKEISQRAMVKSRTTLDR